MKVTKVLTDNGKEFTDRLFGFVQASAAEFSDRGLRLATVTVAGQDAPGTGFDPDSIAQAFRDLHSAEASAIEVVFDGSPPARAA